MLQLRVSEGLQVSARPPLEEAAAKTKKIHQKILRIVFFESDAGDN